MTGLKILLVEDNYINRRLATQIFLDAGAVVETADNGREALDTVKKNRYDAVMMDIQMPEMDGYLTAREIRRWEAGKLEAGKVHAANVPIIAMTAHAMKGDREKCLAAGMNDYVTKPIDKQQLFSTLIKWTSGPEDILEGELHGKSVGSAMDTVSKEERHADFTDDIHLEEIRSVDIKSGLARIGGNTRLYRTLLISFAKDYGDAAVSIKNYLDRGDFIEAEALAHTLKGIAANLSAFEVVNVAEKMEEAIQTGKQTLFDDRVHKMETVLKQTIAEIETFPDWNHPCREPGVIPEEKQTIKELIINLAVLINEDDLEAKEGLDLLKKQIQREISKEEISMLERSLDNFEFDAAGRLLIQIAESLEISLKGYLYG